MDGPLRALRLPLLAAAAALALASTPTLAGTRGTPAPGALTLAVEDAAAPWSMPDGTGLANDVVRAALAAAGQEVRFEVVSYARCKRMAVDGAVAGCLTMSPDPELAASVELPALPIFTVDVELVGRRDARLAASDARGRLAGGAVVGVVVGYEYPDTLRRLARAGHVVLVPARSEEINLRKLADGRVDAAVVTVNATRPLAYLAARAHVPGAVRPLGALGRMPAYVGFSRAHPGGARGRAAFEAGMRRIAASGELARIEGAWRRRLVAAGVL
jgi:polar amino acid transport system substrate-binding protein